MTPGGDGYKPARQARSAKSEQKLLDAGEALFAEKGYQDTKIADIIARSGCSTGTFYHRFGDKEGLARVMIARFIAESEGVIDALDLERSAHGDLRGLMTSLAGLLFDTMNTRLGVYRAAHRLNTLASDGTTDTGILVEPLGDKVLAYLPQYADEIAAPDKAAAMRHAMQMVITIIWQTRLGAGPLFPKDRDALTEMVVQAAMGLLRQEDIE